MNVFNISKYFDSFAKIVIICHSSKYFETKCSEKLHFYYISQYNAYYSVVFATFVYEHIYI